MRKVFQLAVWFGAAAACLSPQVFAQSRTETRQAEVEVIPDTVYGHKDGLALTFDVLKPTPQNGAAVVFINSGGWHSPIIEFTAADDNGSVRMLAQSEMIPTGLAETFSPWPLLEAGFTVINLRHGSVPRFQLPEIVDDIRLAIAEISENAQGFGIDRDRIGLWGGSAGGHLALIGSNAFNPDELADPARIAAVVAYFPPGDLGPFLPLRLAEPKNSDPFSVAGVTEENAFSLSPINFASSDDPPTLIVHGDADPLVPLAQGQLMRDALVETGATADLVVIEGGGHGFTGDGARKARDAMLDWFRRYLN